ncbi:uncharacterized protein [Linepithema humile]|uniref:uncharacterized protein n=1 Tax=Linepithema humile TaxID=83485 RepID=UPI00351DC847
MKRIVLFVLALVAAAIANEEETVKHLAEKFETDVQTVEMCFQEADTNTAEIHAAQQTFMEMKSENDLDEETKKVIMKHGRFLACMLEKKDMMKDSKLVLDKILEMMDSEETKHGPSKEDITECVNEINEANEMNKEDRALELILCFMDDQENNGEK